MYRPNTDLNDYRKEDEEAAPAKSKRPILCIVIASIIAVVVIAAVIGIVVAIASKKNSSEDENMSSAGLATQQSREDAIEALKYTNEYRASQNLSKLYWNEEVFNCAENHSIAMANGSKGFNHDGFATRVRSLSFISWRSAENIYMTTASRNVPRSAVNAWINSEGHRRNLEGNYTHCAIGVSRSTKGVYYTQIFVYQTSLPNIDPTVENETSSDDQSSEKSSDTTSDKSSDTTSDQSSDTSSDDESSDVEYEGTIEMGKEALQYTNDYRATKELDALQWEDEVYAVALNHSIAMASGAKGFNHDGFADRVRGLSFVSWRSAENIYMTSATTGTNTPRAAVDAWIKSSGHERNMVGNYTHCAVAGARVKKSGWYYTQLFVYKK